MSAGGNPVGSTMCSILIFHLSWRWGSRGGDPSLAWDRRFFPFLVQNQKERSRKVAEHVTVCSVSFIQPNLLHSIAASRVFTRTVAVKGIDMALIKET
jgi:hypothetical protein